MDVDHLIWFLLLSKLTWTSGIHSPAQAGGTEALLWHGSRCRCAVVDVLWHSFGLGKPFSGHNLFLTSLQFLIWCFRNLSGLKQLFDSSSPLSFVDDAFKAADYIPRCTTRLISHHRDYHRESLFTQFYNILYLFLSASLRESTCLSLSTSPMLLGNSICKRSSIFPFYCFLFYLRDNETFCPSAVLWSSAFKMSYLSTIFN